jgi:hypothetical protein
VAAASSSPERASAAERPPKAERDATARVPDFFIVGHKKSGTTALYRMLRTHPQVFMPDLKEPHYLASDRRAHFKNPRGSALPQTLEEYLSLFAPAGRKQRAGEASASYLWSRTAAAAIAELQPAARIIAILREPASFLRSQHLQFLRIHFETQKDLRKAMALEDARREGRRIPRGCPYPQMILYSDHVKYVEQLRRYHAHFPREQVLVLIYDDFRRDNDATLRSVLRFLDVDDSHQIDSLDANVTSSTMRAAQLDDLMHSVSMGSGALSRSVRAALRALTPREARRSAARALRRRVVFAEPPPPDEGFMTELRRRFKPEVIALSEYLDRDLVALWGYDQLA